MLHKYDKVYQLHLPVDEAQQMWLSSLEVLVLKLNTIYLPVSFWQASVYMYHFVEAICGGQTHIVLSIMLYLYIY